MLTGLFLLLSPNSLFSVKQPLWSFCRSYKLPNFLLPSFYVTFSLTTAFPSFASVWAHWLLGCSLNTLNILLPQGLCTYYFLCSERSHPSYPSSCSDLCLNVALSVRASLVTWEATTSQVPACSSIPLPLFDLPLFFSVSLLYLQSQEQYLTCSRHSINDWVDVI